jgi:crotonobetainyl-CoA:carnitine CoA-transferase CaiB-like acyl-CoA transferase
LVTHHPDPSPRSPLLLSNLRVLELASVLAGPSVGTFLAELGASVTKVENRSQGGDVTRTWKTAAEDPETPLSAYYASVNWNKTTLWADLKNPDDLRAVQDQARQADVLLASFRAGDDRRYGLDPETLLQQNPALLYARISGFGPDQARPAYDLVLQAETGWMAMNGLADGPGIKLPVALIDVLAAHQLKEGLLLALLEREKSGQGGLIEVSLYDAAISALANQASNYLMTGTVPGRLGSLHPNIAPYGEQFPCQDGEILVLAVGSDAQFQALCKVLEQESLAAEPAFAQNPDRVRNRGKLYNLLQPLFALQPASHWSARLEQAGVPAGQIRNLAQVFEQPAAKAMQLPDPDGQAGGQRTRQVAFYLHPGVNNSKDPNLPLPAAPEN